MTRSGLLAAALAVAAPLGALAAAAPAAPAKPVQAAPAETPAARSPEEELAAKPFLRGRDAAEEELAREWSEALRAYRVEADGFRAEVQALIEQRHAEKRAELSDSYERAIGRLEEDERKERLSAIAVFERFLARYPGNPRYTPDAIFRLAELHYEKSKDDSAEAMIAYEAALRAVEAGERKHAGEMPKADFSQSVGLYRRLIAAFPAYANLDAVHYLLAYCLELQGEPDESRRTYLALIERWPESKFVPEAWVRMGEYYFDAPDGDPTENLRKAAEAYGRMLAYPDHALYDKALYKLGWTYYRLDEYDAAVDAFVKLVDHYAELRKKDDAAIGDLREEALQYTAISFTDEAWGGLDKAQAYFARIGGRAWEGEIYRRIGDILWDIQRKDAAGRPVCVDAYKLFLARAPLDPEAPKVQARIVAAYARERLFEDEVRERDVLVYAYGEGRPWFEKNKDDPELVAEARALTEQALKVAAIFHHTQAQQHRKDGKLQEAFHEYAAAAKAYGEYLAQFPHTKDLYELTYYHAECLYNSTDFLAAAGQYERVRDFDGEDKYRTDAAYAAVLAYQKAMEKETAEGRLPPVKALTSKERPEDAAVTPRSLAPIHARFVAAADDYAARVEPDENAPAIAFKAAELYYAHDDFPEARKRFEEVIVRFPKDPVAQSAANLIIETYLVSKDWVNVQEATAKLLERQDIELAPELRGNLTTFKLGAIFKQANLLMEQEKHEEAAAEYLRLVKEKPDHEFADKALNNAAVCFERSERFDSAMKTYERIIAEYPKSSFADAALFRVAENARKSYDFDKAVTRYEQLVREYPDSKERANALNNLAVLLVGLQRYDEGARAYQRFAELYPDDPDAPKNQYRAAVVYEREEDWRKLIPALEGFVRKFGGDSKQDELMVQARLKIARAHEKLGNDRAARNAFETCTGEFDRRYGGGRVPEPGASAAAAECAFQLAEYEFASWDKLRIEGSRKALEASFKRKRDKVPELKDGYLDVARYKNVDWTLAAFYRKAYVLERLANAFLEAPIPPEVKRLGVEAEDLYRGKIAEAVVALEDGAVKDYQETLEQARRFGIANEWTRRTLESLNRYRPKEYPILKEALVQLQREQHRPAGLALVPTGHPAAPAGPAPAAPAAPGKIGGKLGGPAAVGPAPVPAAPPPSGAIGVEGAKLAPAPATPTATPVPAGGKVGGGKK